MSDFFGQKILYILEDLRIKSFNVHEKIDELKDLLQDNNFSLWNAINKIEVSLKIISPDFDLIQTFVDLGKIKSHEYLAVYKQINEVFKNAITTLTNNLEFTKNYYTSFKDAILIKRTEEFIPYQNKTYKRKDNLILEFKTQFLTLKDVIAIMRMLGFELLCFAAEVELKVFIRYRANNAIITILDEKIDKIPIKDFRSFLSLEDKEDILELLGHPTYFEVIKFYLFPNGSVTKAETTLDFLQEGQTCKKRRKISVNGSRMNFYEILTLRTPHQNISSGTACLLNFAEDYMVDSEGFLTFPETSCIHDLYVNSSEVKDDLIYFDYDASTVYDQLRLSNADGFFVNFTLPAIYYEHTAIEKLTINFNDFLGNTFSKVYWDYDLRKFFLNKEDYEVDIFGLGKMIIIPLYIDMSEIAFSNPHNIFDPTLLESISFTIADSERWPGSFIQEFEEYSVLNLPYQRVGLTDLKLYNLIADSIEADDLGFVNSTVTFKAPDYYGFYSEVEFKIKRLDIEFTDLKVYVYEQLISDGSTVDIEYSDLLELNYRFNNTLAPVILNDITVLPIALINVSAGDLEILSSANAYWVTKLDRDSLSGYYTNYYYSRIQVPVMLGEVNVSFGSLGTPLFNISFANVLSFTLNITQELLDEVEPIYLAQDTYEVEYGHSLLLEGCVRDNDEYFVLDEAYDYRYQEALDGRTIHHLELVSPFGDGEYINKEEFAIYYVNNASEIIPLYSNINGNYYKNSTILDYNRDPEISYVDNAFLLNIYWEENSIDFIHYDTHLLISYKVVKGRPISPISYSSVDSYGNNLEQNLIEIPFTKYDILSREWITEDDFIEQLMVDQVLLIEDVEDTNAILQGPQCYDGKFIQTGVINMEGVYVNWSGSDVFELLNESEYSWSINANGELSISGLPYSSGDVFKVAYYGLDPVPVTHMINNSVSSIDSIKVINKTGFEYEFQLNTDYVISADGYKLYFMDLFNSILKSGNFTIFDYFEIQYHSSLSRKIDLSQNLLLTLQDSQGNDIPIDNVPIDNLGFFEYEQTLREDLLSIPLGSGKQLVRMTLKYLPLNVFNKSAGQLENIDYTDPIVGKIYPYKESNSWAKPFTVITIPSKVKLEMIEDPAQDILITQKFYEEREYFFNFNPVEALQEGEEYTKLMIDALAQENYTFTLSLTDFENKPVNNSIVWLHVGFMPKSKSGFINERAIINDLGVSPYFEALGTEEITFQGPGVGPDKMFGRPLTYELEYYYDNFSTWGPYVWVYGVTDEFGEVSFDISFEEDYLEAFTDIFGSIEGISSINDMIFYIRAFSNYFEWEDMTIDTPNQYLCSKDGQVFDGAGILANYSFNELAIQDSTYVEGLIRLYKGDIALGINDYYSYNLPNPDTDSTYDPLTLHLYMNEADPIPTTSATTLESLTKVYSSSELEPLPYSILADDYTYYAYIQFYTPSGNLVETLYKEIHEGYDSGIVEIDNETVYELLLKLGPGIATIKVQVVESEYYKASPIVIVPLEVVPAYHIRFGQKNSIIDLIDPFVSAWGTAYNNGEEMVFESNYPHLIGSIWVEPFYNETGDELSIQDYIEIALDCTIYNDDGTTSTFPLENEIMLRPGNWDGVMTFSTGLGPESAFLMGLQCDLNLSFSIDFNKEQIFEDLRDVEIYLLDLRLEANPSSSTPNTTWSIYDDGFSSSEIMVETIEETISTDTGVLYLGGTQYGQDYGQGISFIFNNDTLDYGLDADSELLNLLALTEIVALKVIGIKDGDEYEFEQTTDWTMPYYPSGILANDSIISFTGVNLPDEGTEFSVIYKLKFDFGSNYYGKVSLGYTNSYNESSVELQLPSGFLPVSNNSYSPMFMRFNQTCDGTTTDYTLDYGRQSAVVSDFIIYNEEELEVLNNNNPLGKSIVNNHLKITFGQAPGSPFEVLYGVRSLYELGYGFQKVNKSYSDSVRLMYNEDTTSKILDESSNQLSSYDLEDPSLYISLDDSNESTTLKLLNVPLLYAPEINITFMFDHVLLDLIDTFNDLFNNLTIEFKYITNDGFYEFYSDPIVIPLNYSEISLDIIDNTYSIYYNKDLQSIYDMVGVDSLDIEITLRQVGESNRFIPYIILEQYDYLTDTHLVENYDKRPLDKYGDFDINAVVNTPHYYQAFTLPFVDCVYGDSPFNLIDGSEVTVGLQSLPNATLVSVDSDGVNYDFDFWGPSKTLPVNAENFYMIPNLGMFVDTYDIAEPLYQEGYLDLYYGSGTEIDGEEQYTTTIFMDYESSSIADYQSFISGNTPTSWENTYDFTDQFITTDIITVEGRVFYHQLFDLDVDVNSSSVMNDLFPDYSEYIYFGVELPQGSDIDAIRTVGDPYLYSLSIQGFPVGNYKDEYCTVDTYYSGSFDPIQDVLDDDNYALEYDENGTAFILFFKPVGDLSSYTDSENKVMIDYWSNYEFIQDYEYYIHEDPEDPYISQIEWDFSFIDENSFRLHPDFNDETSFTVEYSTLEWEIFNQLYIEDGVDIFTFQPKEYYNVSILYTGESTTDVFSIQYIVPEGQYKEDHLLYPSIYVLAQLGTDEDTMTVLEAFNDPTKSFIVQDAPDSCNYTIDFAEIETYIQNLYNPNYQLVENSYLYVLAKYDSILLRYPMEHTPFNYEYLGEDHDVYHIALSIDGEFIAYSNETTFHDYVLKIENGYIYFNNRSQGQDGYIDPQSKVKLEYKFKLQPGLLDRKHFLIVTYPWTNVFENSVLDPINTEKYRKLSGGSIITPFEYSLSIDNKYSLYLSYRLNEREYYEEAFEISVEHFDSGKNGYVYEFMSTELDNYVDVLNIDGEDLINIYYFDRFNEMRFLDPSHYTVNIGSRQIIIKNDENPLALQNSISKFYMSFIPESNDLEFDSYRFSYDPTLKITETLNMLYWDVVGLEGIDIIPNLNAFYFLNEKESSVNNYICHASQLAAYLNEGEELEFNLEGELNDYDEDLLNAIQSGDYLSLYFDTNMKNIESLDYLSIELYDNVGLLSGFTQNITRSELEMWDNTIKVNLPSTSNTLKKIRFVPIFRTDSEYDNDNTIGIARIQTALWDSEFVSFMEDGQEYMHVDLEFDLKTELDGFELAYIFNDKLQYLTFQEDFSLNYTKDMDIYSLHIPAIYLDPDTNATVCFREEQTIVIRYNSPVKRGLALGIGKMYFESKGYNYDSHPDIPKAEIMLVEASSSEAYSEFTSDYYYQTSLQLTPFDTEYNNRFKTVKIDLNLTALYESTSSSLLNFTHLLFSVPKPSYELTINEVLIIEESSEPTTQSDSMDSRVWQYTEVEFFTASESPGCDSYQLSLENTPLLYPDSRWLDYLNIYDEDGNYYTAGLTGSDHQLHFEPSNNTFTWNPTFNQYPEYFGMEFEEPLIIEANKTLYFEYVTNTSWAEPIRIEVENIDLDSIRVIYDYNYLLKPEHYDWYIQLYNAAHSYENIAYSFKEEIEYRVVQYYYESFAVYSEISQYNHTFDIGDLSFENDFVNLSLYKVIGLTPTFDSEILTDNDDFTVEFNEAAKTLTITDLNTTNGYLNAFDQITVILNYSYAPISSFSEIFLLDQFNQTYLSDIENTFYNYVDIDYRFLSPTGVLFAESSTAIISDLTSFEAIDYCRNPDMSDNNELIGYGSEIFDNFEIYQDESSIIYTSDIDMDREPDYKHTIDVNKDGKVDVIRYGINDPQGSGEIYWHTVIQDFEGAEVNIKQEQPEELRTKWFDLDDRTFAKYDFNVGKLIRIVLTLPLLSYHISKMMLPDVDYWAQKSTQQFITKEEYIKSNFYSVKVDENRDGIPDSQVDYERVTVDVYYTVDEYRETILAAKRQNVFTYLASYVASSIGSLFGRSKEDRVFNEKLTKEHLESQDFSTCSDRVKDNAGVLRSTFRKITHNITTTYIDTFEQSTITIIDYNEDGDIEEKRVYSDDFENYEIGEADQFFSGLAAKHLVTNIDTGQQYPVRFDPEIPFSHPANISWDVSTWGPDQVSVKYDSLQVVGEENSYTTNVFESTIILRIPNRYSLYHDYGKSSKANVVDDGYVEFEVSGMLITPQDGHVYYTSDIQSFTSGRGKVEGHYFYVDSDQNGYYETVYIVSDISTVSPSGIPMYDVISIGYNYDGIHDFVPYERINKKEHIITNFNQLKREKAKFGSDWVYNFRKLDGNDLLLEEESIWDRYKPKDQIFEIHKLVEPSEKNRRFSKLFYEVRHEAYSNAWKQYRKQLISDIAEQVFMSVTATCLSAAVHAMVVWIPFGVGPALAEVLRPITYFLTYTLMTKFFIDIKLHEADSRMRSDTFYPVSSEVDKPTTLNHRSKFDRILKDSMAAALIGHPGGYYTTVSGGEPGNMYTAEVLVSPPNYARMKGSLKGLLDLLWENLLNMGESDPDVYRALDFDKKNLDYLLLTSELPAYNHRDSYTYENTNDLYDQYYGNTLGFLESKVRSSSSSLLDMIRATCVDGRPHYEFINSTVYGPVMPQLVLYKPIVLNEQWYEQIQPRLGHLTVKVQCPECSGSSGMGAYNLSYVENQAGYKAKIPLFGNGFEYPINHISIDFVKNHPQDGIGYFAQDLILNESYYSIDSGNLYFTLPVEEIISEKYQLHDDVLHEIRIGSYADSDIYYDVHIYFDVFIPDTTEETHSLALAQATLYSIMDYFNQYTYAEVTANMISEIAYTETVTFWSTLISVPLLWFGSWAAKGSEAFLGQAGAKAVGIGISKLMVQMITAPIKEVFEEIIRDGFIEAFAEGAADIMGWSEDIGFWLSSLGTSGRETFGPLGKIALGKTEVKSNIKNAIALSKAKAAGDMKTVAEIQARIKQEAQQQLELAQQEQQQKKMWRKVIGSSFFKGFAMILPGLFIGSFDFLSFAGLSNMLAGAINIIPYAFADYKTKIHAYKSNKLRQVVGDKALYSYDSLVKQMKRPADIDGEALNNLFKGKQETGIINSPLIDVSILFNSNPVETSAREELTKKFNEIQISDWIAELTQDVRFEEMRQKFEDIKKNFKSVGFQKSKEDIMATIEDALQGADAKDLRYIDINGLVMLDPNFVLVGLPHFNPEQDIHIPFNQPVKDFVNDLKRQYYTISYKVKLALLKDDQFIEIDENSEEHITYWLINNGYSRDETIYILPVDKDLYGPIYERGFWTKGTPSPYTTHFDKFRKQLTDLAYKLCFINEYTPSAASNFLFPHPEEPEAYLLRTFTNLKQGKNFNVREASLQTMHARLLNKLETDYKADQFTESEYIEYFNEINKLFDEQYSIYGFSQPNFFYLEGRLLAHKIGDILMDYGFIDRNEVTGELYNFIKPFGAPLSILLMENYRGEDNKYRIPYESSCPKLIQSLESAILDFALNNDDITNDIAEEVKEKINALINDLSVIIEDSRSALKMFRTWYGYKRSYAKIDLLMLIQRCHPALRRVSSMKKFSKLLFGDESFIETIFISDIKLKARPEPYLLHRITFNALRWTIDDFDGFISDSELENVKNKVEGVVYDWMFSNPYSILYVTETPRRFGKLQQISFLKLEYELMQVLTHAVSVYNDQDMTSFVKVLDDLNIPTAYMGGLLTVGEQSAIIRDLLRARNTIVSYILDGSMTEQKLQFYDRALAKIDEYIATRHLRLFEYKIVSKRGYDKKLWDDGKIKAYHVITLLCRDLGFDPLTFQPLNPLIFDADPHTGLYARHHLDIRRKFSIYLQNLLLTDNSQHRHYDSYIPLSDQKILVQIIQDLIQNDGSGPNKEITAKDVVKTFLSNFGDPNTAKHYLENYWQSGDFQKNLKDFNERKDMIKNGDYEEFIKIKYNDAYTRFFGNAMNILNSLSELSEYKGYRLSRVFSIADIAYLRRIFSI